jgi:hypothetical protein
MNLKRNKMKKLLLLLFLCSCSLSQTNKDIEKDTLNLDSLIDTNWQKDKHLIDSLFEIRESNYSMN